MHVLTFPSFSFRSTLSLKIHAMCWIKSLLWFCVASAVAQSTEGLYSLVKRRLPNHGDQFRFTLDANFGNSDGYDQYLVQTADNGTVLVHGNSLSALSSGYSREEIHRDPPLTLTVSIAISPISSMLISTGSLAAAWTRPLRSSLPSPRRSRAPAQFLGDITSTRVTH